MGHTPSPSELKAVIRRIDTDGDGKLRLDEFTEGIKSQFALVNNFGSKMPSKKPMRQFMDGNIGHMKEVKKPKRKKSSAGVRKSSVRKQSEVDLTPLMEAR